MAKCKHCGGAIIFRPYRKHAKTQVIERPRRARVFVIHLSGTCDR